MSAERRWSRLTYPKPVRVMGANVWSARWRRRWSATVGPIFVEPASGNLVAMFPAAAAPGGRLVLQAEIEARSNGPAQVIGACNAIQPVREPTTVTADYARDWVRRWYAAGGKIRVGDRGCELVRGFNSDAMVAEWSVVKSAVMALAGSRNRSGGRRYVRRGTR